MNYKNAEWLAYTNEPFNNFTAREDKFFVKNIFFHFEQVLIFLRTYYNLNTLWRRISLFLRCILVVTVEYDLLNKCVHEMLEHNNFYLCKDRKIEIGKRDRIIFYFFLSILYHDNNFVVTMIMHNVCYIVLSVLRVHLHLAGNSKCVCLIFCYLGSLKFLLFKTQIG